MNTTDRDIAKSLQSAVATDADDLRRLHDRLAASAAAEHLVDIAYRDRRLAGRDPAAGRHRGRTGPRRLPTRRP